MVFKFLEKLHRKNKEPKQDVVQNNGDSSHTDANQEATPPQTEIHNDTKPEVVTPQAESQTHAEPEVIAPNPAVQVNIAPEDVPPESEVRKQALGAFKTCLDLASIVLSALPIQAPKAAVDTVRKLVTDYEVSFPCDLLVLALMIDGLNADHVK